MNSIKFGQMFVCSADKSFVGHRQLFSAVHAGILFTILFDLPSKLYMYVRVLSFKVFVKAVNPVFVCTAVRVSST